MRSVQQRSVLSHSVVVFFQNNNHVILDYGSYSFVQTRVHTISALAGPSNQKRKKISLSMVIFSFFFAIKYRHPIERLPVLPGSSST